MPTQKPRVLVTLDEAPHRMLRRFAAQNELTLSELVAAIVQPVAAAIAWQIKHREEDEPSLFPEALLKIYDDPEIDGWDAVQRLQDAFEALRRNRIETAATGFLWSPEVVSAEDGATAPPAGANDRSPASPRRLTPRSNTGVTSSRKGPNKPNKVSKPGRSL